MRCVYAGKGGIPVKEDIEAYPAVRLQGDILTADGSRIVLRLCGQNGKGGRLYFDCRVQASSLRT